MPRQKPANRTPTRPGLIQLDDLTGDPVRRMIAQCVQHALVTGPDRPPLYSRPDSVVSVTGTPISATTIEVVITLDNDTSRTFLVKVQETH